MEITKTVYVTNRKDWRRWLSKHHATEKEIWLIYYRKDSGKPRGAYHDAVDEAICFGWIDSIVKKVDDERFAQRFTPRRPKSPWSELNKQRARKLIEAGKMTKAGRAVLGDLSTDSFKISPDILKALKTDNIVWKNFQQFPWSYKRIRAGYIEGARKRPVEFKKRLAYFVKMTAQKKMFGWNP